MITMRPGRSCPTPGGGTAPATGCGSPASRRPRSSLASPTSTAPGATVRSDRPVLSGPGAINPAGCSAAGDRGLGSLRSTATAPASSIFRAGEIGPVFSECWEDRILSRDSGLRPACRFVACALAKHMSRNGDSCYISIDLLADETGHSRRTVQRALRDLEQVGWINITRGGGRSRRSEYGPSSPEKTPRATPLAAAAEAPPTTREPS